MKKIFTFLLACLVAASVHAAEISSRIAVSFAGSKDYRVSINGRSYYSGNNKMALDDLRVGRYDIQVFAVRNNGRQQRPVYATSFVVRPQYDMNIIVDRNGKVRFDEIRAVDRYGSSRGQGNRDWDNRGGSYNRNRDYDHSYRQAISDYDFSRLLQRLESPWTGSSMISVAREAVTGNNFYTHQLKRLITLFRSESDRLEIAQLAYRNTIDHRNFHQLYDQFSRRSQAALDRYTKENWD